MSTALELGATTMPDSKLSIFVSAPSDVASERDECERILTQYKKRMSLLKKIDVDYFMWPQSVIPNVGSYGQAEIGDQTKSPDRPAYDHDIVICLLWTRIGTPTRYFLSGTTEELVYSLMNSYRRHKYVMLYLSDIPASPSKIEPDQLAKIRILTRCFQRFGGLFSLYDSIRKFNDSLLDHLDRASNDILTHWDKPTGQKVKTQLPVIDMKREYPEHMHLLIRGLNQFSVQLQHNTRACVDIMCECAAHFQDYLAYGTTHKMVDLAASRADLQNFSDMVEKRFTVRSVVGEQELLHQTKVVLAFLPCLQNKAEIELGHNLSKCAHSFVDNFKNYDEALRALNLLLENGWPSSIYAFSRNSVLGRLANEAKQLSEMRNYARGIADLLDVPSQEKHP